MKYYFKDWMEKNPEYKNHSNLEDYIITIKILDIIDISNAGGSGYETKKN